MNIPPQAIETFRRDGVTVIRNALSDAWLARLAVAIAVNMENPGPNGKNHADEGAAYFGDYVNWQRIPAYLDVVREGPLGEIAGRLMETSEVRFFHEHVLVKEPGNASMTPWHQDLPYYCVDGDKTISLWVPLDPVDKSVCPQYLAGSHRGNMIFAPRRFKTLEPLAGDISCYAPFPDIDEVRDAHRILSFNLQPGDAIAFDFHLLHNAPPNTSGTRRRAISFRFVGDGVRYVERPHEVSPPFPEMGLKLATNDPLPDEWFPVVWRNPVSNQTAL